MTREEIQDKLRECINHAYRENYEDIETFGSNVEYLDKTINLLNELVEILNSNKTSEQKACEDAISRQAAIDINHKHHGEMPNHINHQIWQEIKDLPPVTPHSKIGHWIYTGDYLTEGMLKCSECGEEIDVSESYYGYCPNCGVKMQEVGK